MSAVSIAEFSRRRLRAGHKLTAEKLGNCHGRDFIARTEPMKPSVLASAIHKEVNVPLPLQVLRDSVVAMIISVDF